MEQTPRYTVRDETLLAYNQRGLVLVDAATGAEARILPDNGANLTGLRLASRGQALELMPPDPQDGSAPSRLGAPVLFPYPNRVRHARYTWNGEQYSLPANPQGHAIHGLVVARPFRETARHGGANAASVTLEIAAQDDAAFADHYPFDFRFALTFTLGPSGLRTSALVENRGDQPMPFGLGFHPYFRLPLVPHGRREDCRLQLWAAEIWELDQDYLTSGAIAPIPPALDARGYPAFGTTYYDTLYTRLALDDPGAGTWTARYLDPAAGVEVLVTADQPYREAVLYAPATRPVVCIEPYTCATDAFNLHARGLDAGVIVLAPGQQWSAGYTIGLRRIDFAA